VINAAVKRTAIYLNNTPAVCRSSYIDPRVFDRYLSGETIAPRLHRIDRATDDEEFADRDKIEAAVLDLLG
jgi:DNA topoisomerase IB